MIVNVFLRNASSPGVARRVKETSFESTFGAGQKTDLETEPAPLTSAHHAALTEGTPYSFVPG